MDTAPGFTDLFDTPVSVGDVVVFPDPIDFGDAAIFREGTVTSFDTLNGSPVVRMNYEDRGRTYPTAKTSDEIIRRPNTNRDSA